MEAYKIEEYQFIGPDLTEKISSSDLDDEILAEEVLDAAEIEFHSIESVSYDINLKHPLLKIRVAVQISS